MIGNWLRIDLRLRHRRLRRARQRYRRVGLDRNSAFEFRPRGRRGNRRCLQREAARPCWLVQVAPRGPLQIIVLKIIAAARAVAELAIRKAGAAEARARGWLRPNFRQELRDRPRLHQRRPHRLAHEIMNYRLLPETHLGLLRMHVDIDLLRRHLDKKQNHGIDRWRQNVAIGLGDPVLNETVANEASIHENKN